MKNDQSQSLQKCVSSAYRAGTPLHIQGAGSKSFYGCNIEGTPLSTTPHVGIVNYEPTELVVSARAGTPLLDIEKALKESGQMLGFEPPSFGLGATLGGTIAGNFSGPRRAYAGAARDFVLGCKILNGKGEIMKFGGEVMKNVAGYDVSRLMTGALGTLGVLLEISLKVLPKPEMEITRKLSCTDNQALEKLQLWSQQPLPITASFIHDSALVIRFSGVEKAVVAAANSIGGDDVDDAETFWLDLKEQRMDFFSTDKPLWRISLAPDLPPLDLQGEWLYEWNGALRWYKGDLTHSEIRTCVDKCNGHATLFRNANMDNFQSDDVFHPLPKGLMRIHKNLKIAFDPKGILNPGILYPAL